MAHSSWNMLTDTHLANLPVHSRYFAYSKAYLDSALRLCRILARSKKKATYERGAVVLFLTQHGLELFYKGAIYKKTRNERFEHGVSKLRKRYRNLYPAKVYDIPDLFKTSYLGMSKSEIAKLENSESPAHELYRYPEDKKGNAWKGLFGFEASSFENDLKILDEKLENAINHIDA